MKNIDLELYKIFYEVGKEKNITRAGERSVVEDWLVESFREIRIVDVVLEILPFPRRKLLDERDDLLYGID